VDTWPRSGPETGGTEITITLTDFPANDGNNPVAYCLFPGFEDNYELGLVLAHNLTNFDEKWLIHCTTPAIS
jgi:hypothetical protein